MTASTASPASALRRLTITELRLYARERIGPIWGTGFPLLLLVIFGSIPSFNRPNPDFGGRTELDIYIPVLIALVTALLSLVALPTALTAYREQGVLRRLRTTPVGPSRVLAAQLLVNAAMLAITVTLILAVARFAYGIAMPSQFLGFVVAAVLAAAALMSIGLLIAAVAPSGRAAQAIGTILFFPMMFFAGLWLPLAQMPPVLRHVSHAFPLGAAVQALQDAAAGHWPHPLQLATMGAYAIGCGLAAMKLFRWE